MEKQHTFLLIIFSLFLLTPIADAKDDCPPASCGPNQPEIRFPFRILGRQPDMCGFYGFNISCDEQNRTTIQFPLSSVSYIVNEISYLDQVMYVDPEFCRPNRIVSVITNGTEFSSRFSTENYGFYNCSLPNYSPQYTDVPFPCLSNQDYSVIAVQTDPSIPGDMPSSCKFMKNIAVPIGLNNDFRYELELMWLFPYCRACEKEGKFCRWNSDDEYTMCVSSSHGISRGVIYGLSIGIGVPLLICIIGVAWYRYFKEQGHNNSNNEGIGLSSVAIIRRKPSSKTGLDGPTIESYPKTLVGDSCSLPNDDRTCAICLSDYKSKESLRTIPECNHYFHVECIDEWLKLNVTCPVCRKTPECSTLVTPCSNS